ncbi:MAG: aminotransferase class V-fold PLP-dependent enzyme [Proteobacteria bacterium]|nr:aminotransferase class V-fold PLP-dependent enzyme [Pseudomonadota bacterium]
MESKKILYLDHCGTTPLNAGVREAMRSSRLLDSFGNASATHHARGNEANTLIEEARGIASSMFKIGPKKILFTSGASEANNMIIQGFWLRFRDRGCRVLYSSIEHKSILDPSRRISDLPNGTSFEVPVNSHGVVDLIRLEAYLAENPSRTPTLVAIMHTNNEVPVRQPVEDVARLCHSYGAYFHCDAVQGFVREEITFDKINYGSIVVSSHKIYGPKGCGILIFGDSRTSPMVSPLCLGGDQEMGLRPGSLNTLTIAATSIALKEHSQSRSALVKHMLACDQVFIAAMSQEVPGFHLTVPNTSAAAGIVNFYIDGRDAQSILLRIPNVCLNRGASCAGAGGTKSSHVPLALGLPVEIQTNVLRASFGWGCSTDDVINAVAQIKAAAKPLA